MEVSLCRAETALRLQFYNFDIANDVWVTLHTAKNEPKTFLNAHELLRQIDTGSETELSSKVSGRPNAMSVAQET